MRSSFHFISFDAEAGTVLSFCARLIYKTVAIKHIRLYRCVFFQRSFVLLGTQFCLSVSSFFFPVVLSYFFFCQCLLSSSYSSRRFVPFNNCFFFFVHRTRISRIINILHAPQTDRICTVVQQHNFTKKK